jgi:hypothetical protein
MNRSEAIDEVISYLDRIEGEWGSSGSTDDEVAEVLSALGVTEDELVAHNVIRRGYWYERYLEVAGLVAHGMSLPTVAQNIATSLAHNRPEESKLRNRIFDNIRSGVYGK